MRGDSAGDVQGVARARQLPARLCVPVPPQQQRQGVQALAARPLQEGRPVRVPSRVQPEEDARVPLFRHVWCVPRTRAPRPRERTRSRTAHKRERSGARASAHVGQCNNGDECKYLHLDPNTKLKVCAWYARGFCKNGKARVAFERPVGGAAQVGSHRRASSCPRAENRACLSWPPRPQSGVPALPHWLLPGRTHVPQRTVRTATCASVWGAAGAARRYGCE